MNDEPGPFEKSCEERKGTKTATTKNITTKKEPVAFVNKLSNTSVQFVTQLQRIDGTIEVYVS